MEIKPTFKQRSHDTNNIHLETLSSNNKIYTHMLLGDSLIQNFMNSHGTAYYNELSSKVNIFNAGVGGDRVENVLYRLINGKLLEQSSLRTVTNVYLLIGTNNLHNKKEVCKDIIAAGIKQIIDLLVTNFKYLNKIYILQIPPRSDIRQDLINSVNTKIKELIESNSIANTIIIKYIPWCDIFSDGGKINPIYYSDHVHFSSSGYNVLYQCIDGLLK